MAKKIFVDAAYEEEIRIAVENDGRLEMIMNDWVSVKQLIGNIYVARVSQVVPSLRAVFVEYQKDKYGFLPFSEISLHAFKSVDGSCVSNKKRSRACSRDVCKYLKKNKQILVQIVKDARGNKGVVVTTYVALQGRYCALVFGHCGMNGVPKKINDEQNKERIKGFIDKLHAPNEVGVVVRMSGVEAAFADIKKDFNRLLVEWKKLCEKSKENKLFSLVYEEVGMLARTIRDCCYDIDEIIVSGKDCYKLVKSLMNVIVPCCLKKVKLYDDKIPIFYKYGIEKQIIASVSPVVHLPSGGYIVIENTEAFVSIDVNSGKSIHNKNMENMALKTNIEAAEEIIKQIRLRNLAGLIVIDFIDMDANKNNEKLEKLIQEKMDKDNVKNNVLKINEFGIMIISRQRVGICAFNGAASICSYCGVGTVKPVEMIAVELLRCVELKIVEGEAKEKITICAAADVCLYMLNKKSKMILEFEKIWNVQIVFCNDNKMFGAKYEVICCEAIK